MAKPKKYWNFKRCASHAILYERRVDFLKGSPSAYRAALKNNWLEEICVHMAPKARRNYWTKRRCHEAALEYNSRNEFQKSCLAAYSKAHKQGWIDEICSHMSGGRKPNGYWSVDRIKTEALKFKSRKDFEDGSPAYQAALKKGCIDEVCEHMSKTDHGFFHCVYVILNYELNKAYIGITRNKFIRRMEEHKSSNNKTNSKRIANLPDTEFKQLTPYQFDINQVVHEEVKWFENYLNQGWDLLNDEAALGAIGNTKIFWTKERCFEEAKKYKNKKDFRTYSSKAYNAALRRGWLKEINAFLSSVHNPSGYWTKERISEEAAKYSFRADFRKYASKAYSAAVRRGWLDEVCCNMSQQNKKGGYWSLEKCLVEAKKYDTIKEFRINSPSAYSTILQKGWKDDALKHMAPASRIRKWDKARCLQEAKKYMNRKDFRDYAPGAYKASLLNNWHEEVCAHMK